MTSSDENRTAPGLWWVVLGLSVVLASAASVALWHLRQATIENQARELGLLSRAFTDALDRGLLGAEEGLHAMQLELRDRRLQLSDPELPRRLRTRADLMPLVQMIWLVSREGRVLFSSHATSAPDLSSFSPALDRLAGDVVAVSRPFPGDAGGPALIALAVRVTGVPGIAGGWIFAAMPAEALRGAFAVASPAPDARLAVVRDDGVPLAGTLAPVSMLGEAGSFRWLADMPDVELRRFGDGDERLVTRQSLPRFGLKLVMTRNLEAVLTTWREVARLTATGVALLLAVLAVSVHLLLREYRRSAEARDALQAELARASKLQSLGTLAGGVAHDFNNVLAAVTGFGEMAQDAAAAGSDQARHLDRMMQAASRGKALVGRILAFSRGGARASSVFELEPLVEEALALLSASLPYGTVLERRLEARGGWLRGDPTRVFEATTNLCTNAMQAMPHGGTVVVELGRFHEEAGRMLSHSRLAPGRYLTLTVSDRGMGITSEVMERLFEPFFTTRSHEAGTGLGLAVVHGAVTELGGAIDVRSAPGQGARFTLYLPECPDAPGEPPLPPSSVPGGSGQAVLVVDDEPDLVTLATETLKGLGYEPDGYTDPAAALEALRRDPRRYAAVITDEVMPGFSGTRLTEALRAHAPHVPVLLVSGYGGALLAARAAAAGVTRVLAKPLARAELARALSELLR